MTDDLLSSQLVKAAETDPREWVVMLHGILGQKRNLFGFARQFVQTFPRLGVVLVDLRSHGLSPDLPGPQTLANCAQDLKNLLNSLNLPVRSVVGHSFGAGVACAFADQFHELQSLWLLDAIPSAMGEDSDVYRVLAALSACLPASSKEEFSRCLTASGLSSFLVSWLLMNLYEKDNKFVFKPNPIYAAEMLGDLRNNFNFQLLGRIGLKTNLFVIKAVRNLGWQRAEAELTALIRSGLVKIFDLQNAGHFVHIDNPQGILKMMREDFA